MADMIDSDVARLAKLEQQAAAFTAVFLQLFPDMADADHAAQMVALQQLGLAFNAQRERIEYLRAFIKREL